MPLVLIIEDDDSTRDLLELFVKTECKLSVITARTVKEGLKWLEAFSPKLILLDYLLNGDTADQIMFMLKERYPNGGGPRVVLLTAVAQAEQIASRLNVDYLVKKPFDFEILKQHIDSICELKK